MGKAILKIVVGLAIGAGLWVATMALDFPPVFRWLFFAYAILGTVVFLILDAPSMKPMSGVKALTALVVFYVILCTVYIAGASLWPQYDPEDEKGKIEKILAPKRKATEQGKAEELLARAKALDEQAKALAERIKALGGDQAPASQAAGGAGAPPATATAAGGDILKLGEDQWQLQECYNCHKLKGEGGKKRGPELDNIGNLLTVDEIKEKILDPKSWMAEGFEKEYEKGKMPDKYKDLMEEKDVVALASWLSTFKNPSVNTPKPIKKK
ncbi:c-type cytochrome [Nitrospira moscoviensis]|uniref:Putative Monoheme cytochrome c n=1 Tax=Nitrospira moscoviensis TaxID=42253 RepID=A0A0K2G8I5_NITMO|nr:cytochrome c [Nitrospira moscoviensis]ALA57169.1 putative Monoheme cytochrome c [Nitrospira moscoviensis]